MLEVIVAVWKSRNLCPSQSASENDDGVLNDEYVFATAEHEQDVIYGLSQVELSIWFWVTKSKQ